MNPPHFVYGSYQAQESPQSSSATTYIGTAKGSTDANHTDTNHTDQPQPSSNAKDVPPLAPSKLQVAAVVSPAHSMTGHLD
ncbi:hypothetical protein MMC17_004836 [Xylographa soralifera]|nr:hypothetical protein [Xylographa soralifera]